MTNAPNTAPFWTTMQTRAEFLTLAACGIGLGLAREPRVSNALQDPHTPVRIMLATDMHYLSPRLNDHGAYFKQVIVNSDAKVTMYCDELMEAFVDVALRENPDVLVIPGDLAFNGAVESHEDLIEKLSRIRAAGIPVLVIPGNHDVNCDQAARFTGNTFERVPSATPEQFRELYADYGYTGALSYDDASASYLWELTPNLWLLFVDVNAVKDLGSVPTSTLGWVTTQLGAAREAGARVLAFSHQNLLQQAFIDYAYSITNASALLKLYERAGVLANFSGHLHAQHYNTSDTGLIDVATSALSVTPNQWARITVTDESLSYETVPMGADVSAWARGHGSDDPNLLDFETYALSFFTAKTLYSTKERFAAEGAQNAEELAEFMCAANLGFFSGRLDLVEPRPDLIDQIEGIDPLTGFYLRFVFGDGTVKNEGEFQIDIRP